MGLTACITIIDSCGVIIGGIVLIIGGLYFVGKGTYLYFESWISGKKLINVP